MVRLFLDPAIEKGNRISFNEDFSHLKRVLRLSPGDMVEIVDSDSRLLLVEICGFEEKKERTVGRVLESSMIENPDTGISVAVSVPKKNMDLIVSNLSQLNIDSIHPFISERTVGNRRAGAEKRFISRLNTIARESAKQSRGRKVTRIYETARYGDILECGMQKMLFTLDRKAPPLSPGGTSGRLMVMIGPEGDFSPAELEQAEKAQVKLCRLSGNVMRTENAATVIAAILLYQRGWF